MKISERLKNAYKSGGISEIVRKLAFHQLYKMNGKKILAAVEKKDFEFGLCKSTEREFEVVVSLTTYPQRFDHMELCLKSLISQEVKPDHIIVYLGSDAYNIELPNSMRQFEKYGIEFRYDPKRNLRSHKKYFYAMQDFPNAVVVTADDDIIYPSDWLESLLRSYRKFPDAISARRVHLMRRTEESLLLPYNHWKDQYRKCLIPSHSLFATGNAGILYPPDCLDGRVFDDRTFVKLCYEADDVWLKCMAFLKNSKVVWVPNNEVDLPEVENTLQTSLSQVNVGENKNDMYLKNVMEAYDIEAKDFFQ